MKGLKLHAVISAALAVTMLTVAAACLAIRQARPRALPAHSEQLSAEAANPLNQFRSEREQLRQRQRAELNDMIHDAATDSETRAMAQRQLLRLMEAETAEAQLEGILKARGFEDALVSVDNAAVNVLVRRDSLTQRETAVILDLVLRQTGVTSGNVKIIPIN